MSFLEKVINKIINKIINYWCGPLWAAQKEYKKDHILNKCGDDWRDQYF